jgi:hypothetical protein
MGGGGSGEAVPRGAADEQRGGHSDKAGTKVETSDCHGGVRPFRKAF